MSRPLALLLVQTLVLSLWAQPSQAQQRRGNDRHQFSVAASERGFVLVDQRTGRTWILENSANNREGPVWLPIERIDDPDEADRWRHEQLAITEEREHHQRAEHQASEQRIQRERLENRRRMMERQERENQPQEKREPDRSQTLRNAGLQRLQIRRQFLKSLQKQHESLRDQFGEDHPTVKAMADQIERLEDELEDAADEIEDERQETSKQESEADDILSRLPELLLEEEMLLQTHGPMHPKVRQVGQMIEVIRSMQSEQGIKQKLAEHDQRLKQEEELARQTRQAALRRILLQKQQEIQESITDLQQKHGDSSGVVRSAKATLELIQRALDDLEDSDE